MILLNITAVLNLLTNFMILCAVCADITKKEDER